MITPETIDISALEAIALTDKGKFPDIPVVYFVLSQFKEILYIGKAVSLKNRYMWHHKYDELTILGNVTVAWLPTLKDELVKLEKSCIQHFKPSLNKTNTKPPVLSTSYRLTQETIDDIETLRKRWGMHSGREVIETLVHFAVDKATKRENEVKAEADKSGISYESALITDGNGTGEHVIEYDEPE